MSQDPRQFSPMFSIDVSAEPSAAEQCWQDRRQRTDRGLAAPDGRKPKARAETPGRYLGAFG